MLVIVKDDYTHFARFDEHDPKHVVDATFNNLNTEPHQMFRARFDLHALRHVTSNLELNAEKYRADGTVVQTVAPRFLSSVSFDSGGILRRSLGCILTKHSCQLQTKML